ncbi:MAG: response regulator [Cytophagales bacterium]|nr:MAG: response regulator [Cytophagales bacterium]
MNAKLFYLVDDDEDDRFFAKLTFQQHFSDAELICFDDGEELLAHIKVNPQTQADSLPDLILLDLNMPKINGFDTLAAVKQNEIWKNVPVAILTTSCDTGDKEKSTALGACAFLTKPATYDMLAQTIQSGRIVCGS